MLTYLRITALFVQGGLLSVVLGIEPLFADGPVETQVTFGAYGHILTNIGVWSPDGRWIVYDVRSDPAGNLFDGRRIERVHVDSGEVQVLFASSNQACCGVVTTSPCDDRIVFIHGPEHPDEHWQYAAFHRRGVLVDARSPDAYVNLDARDLIAPYTAGALRGGTHLHTFSGDGRWIAFTYEDHVLESGNPSTPDSHRDANQRNVGVSVPLRGVTVPSSHPRNHSGSHFSVVVTRTTDHPRPGSDDITRAFSDAWIGKDGYVRLDGRRQAKAIAFQGHVRTAAGNIISEVFVVDLPEDVSRQPDSGWLQGTPDLRPQPPRGTRQRRLTFTGNRKYPGIQGVRHWLRSAPDGSRIAFLMKSDSGVSQIWIISPNGGEPQQLTNNQHPIDSAFSWSPDGKMIAHVMDGSVCVTLLASGRTVRLTKNNGWPLRPEACVFSPDGSRIAYVRHVSQEKKAWNQVFVLDVSKAVSQGR